MNQRFYILDHERHAVAIRDVVEWGRWFETAQRHVDQTEIAGVSSGCRISTVFLGIDHRYVGSGPPLLFETMIFGGPLDQSQWRYASWDDAATGHQAAVRKARQAMAESQTESQRQRSGG